MSELINNAQKKKELLKHAILQLHGGQAPETVRLQLIRLLGQVPYNDVVEVEQQLIAEGLPQEEVLKLCDVHTAALSGAIDLRDAKEAPAGHPVHTFKQENRALARELQKMNELFEKVKSLSDDSDVTDISNEIRLHLNAIMDVEKHYQRKENLLFPFLEKHGITGPPTVMWGKHDEARELLNAAVEAMSVTPGMTAEELKSVVELVLHPGIDAVDGMIMKEEEILFPMCLDKLTEAEWYEIYTQSSEIGFCLYDPTDDWKPEIPGAAAIHDEDSMRIKLTSGSFTIPELQAILNTIPFDLTYVDRDDTVRYFTQGRERIFARNRAIIGRKVQLCHPPSSVNIVQKILDDFKSGNRQSAAFWIDMNGRFIHIEYFALRGENGDYLGTLEVSQDLTEKRALKGEKRILAYNQTEA
ncbi:DUF438 domain-containing protein [candidate division KSB1 bacterium]|nr:DUF438 domain-containing protein [candidate division KSB1 bacterium]